MAKPMLNQKMQIFLIFLILPLCLSLSTNPEVSTLFSWIKNSSASENIFSNWDPNHQNPCKWSFITCSNDNLVTQINIPSLDINLPFPPNLSSLKALQVLAIYGSNLTGEIPEEIGDCSSLVSVDLSGNSLVGTVPSGIGRLKKVESLVLNSNQISGKIPSEIGECANLTTLLLYDNLLSGELPVELGKLAKLEEFRLGGNKEISGKIPDEFGNCESLRVLGLADTKVSGSIPSSLGKLSNLQTLSVYTTMISGFIPSEIGNCSELVDLYLYDNSLSGPLPPELGKLQKLEKMLLWQNNFDGPIPEEIGNCKSLMIIDLSLNSLSGSIPKSFGKLSNLLELMISSNNVSGSIPSILSNATNLVQLQFDNNRISGAIPPELGMLTNLEVFFAWQNEVEGIIPSQLAGCKSLQAIDLSHNFLTGNIPSSLFQLQNLSKVLLISNDISGSIPLEIGNCSSLIRLRLAGNRISGEMRREIGLLKSLSFLDLSENNFTGFIPEEISNCTQLEMLNLSNNTLGGYLPTSLASLVKLQVLDVSANKITGQIPESFGNLDSINRFVLSRNSFSGQIPTSLGRCSSLQFLDLSSNELFGTIPKEIFEIEGLNIALNLSWNSLNGTIPSQIMALNKLSTLDLSHNQLSGDLMVFSGLLNLVSLNVSHNNFSGYLPDNKLFRQMSQGELAGNQLLCPLGRDSCFVDNVKGLTITKTNKSKLSSRLKLAIALLSVAAIIMAIIGIIALLKIRKMKKEDHDSEMGEGYSCPFQFTPFQKLNFTVEQVLSSLIEENAIGKGCSGIVYKVRLDNGDIIAVKKLWPTVTAVKYSCENSQLAVTGGNRDSFSTEVKTLGSIRHKNIVRFLGCCWNRNTRLLMYDYMSNGSLGSVLHEKNGSCLDWDLRYKIVLGAAQGLAYLHHDCVPPIVHRDIKANNILIGLEFEAYIADFGLAKLVDDGDFPRSSNTLAGSYGYIAPEYGYMMKITEKSDVYSYGVVVLEVLTGKQPIDPTIPDGLHIVDWVRQKRAGPEVLDTGLQARSDSEIEEMMQTLGVALLCVNPSPDDRPNMKDVAAMLKEIRHEREECEKVDMALKRSSLMSGDMREKCGGASSKKMEKLYFGSNNSSFSVASLLYSSSSNVRNGST